MCECSWLWWAWTTARYSVIRVFLIVAALSARWGTRFRCGTPFRRYLNPTPASTVNLGRCLFRTAIDLFQVQITIGPNSRVPKAPFFCFVEGELMLATHESPPDDTAHDGRTFWVERATDGADPRWNPNVVDHAAGVPVLCVRVPSVYVHAKCMVIDDIFMTVGSANINRRGHFHDGELNVFAVPQRLKNDPTNPARNMRCRLWAEHLGLSPEMGLSLLADPLSALPYFERAWYVGSAFQAFTFNGSSSLTDVNFGTGILSLAVGTGLEAYKSVSGIPRSILRRAAIQTPPCPDRIIPEMTITLYDLLGVDPSQPGADNAAALLWPKGPSP